MTETATPFLAWNDSWLVGIRNIDLQHKKLVSLLNQLHEAMRNGQGSKVLGNILADLVSYTKAHFTEEEQLMQLYKYPELGPHRLDHQKLTARVLDFQREFAAGTVILSVDVMQFLSQWLQGHILGTDKKYAPFLRAQGVR